MEAGRQAQLIHYHRPDNVGPKLSNYTIARTEVSFFHFFIVLNWVSNCQTPEELKAILSETLGELGEWSGHSQATPQPS